jgi:hypothetical protein
VVLSAATSPNSRDHTGDSASTKTQVTELKDLVVGYVKQETVDPLRSLTRFVVWGSIGAVLLSLAGVVLMIAVVRVLQTETGPHLTGNLSWVPYTGAILFALLAVGLALSRIRAKGAKRRSS